MLCKVDKHSGIPAYMQIMNQVKKEVILGNLKNGDQLSPVRELQNTFGVNINTVNRSLEKLSTEGFIDSKHGIGHFVKTDFEVDPEVMEIIKNCSKKLKEKNMNIHIAILLLEEVWKNG
jgi:GntR family transcriptional regulator